MTVDSKARLAVLDYLGGSEAEVFACTREGASESRPRLVLHATPSAGLSVLRERLQAALHGLGSGLPVEVRLHTGSDLGRNRSLQDLAEAFGPGEIVYDPVAAIANARAAVEQAQRLRATWPNAFAGIYFSGRERQLQLMLASNGPEAADLRAGGAFPVRIIKHLPSEPLMAVDRASIESANDAWYASSPAQQAALAASVLVFVGLAQAPDARAQDPAVSGVNGKIAATGGRYDGTNGGMAQGSLTMPVGHSFGLQLDGSKGRYLHENYNGGGFHLFWRDPARGLVGVIGSREGLGGVNQNRIGGEAEAYFSKATLRLRAGRQSGDVSDGAFASLQGRYYLNENLALNLGVEHAPGQKAAKFSAEWQPGAASMPGLSLFAEAETGSNDYQKFIVGVRYYFGGTKSLMQRHRKDDPDTLVPDGAMSLVKTLRQKKKSNGNGNGNGYGNGNGNGNGYGDG